jgi:alpha-L-arabinofuranosidase
VVMAAYAPLFVNVNPIAAQWGTNLIGYDSFKSYGSPSYWGQVLFASALGTDVVASELTGDTSNGKLFYSVTSDPARHELYLKLVNASSKEQSLDVHIEGGTITGNPKVTRVAADAPTATNSIDAPERIVPKAGDAKSRAVPAYSISVYTYKLK